nr:hypothetical protein BaRGS_002245 [Batillaria attramentaria]
MLRKGVLGVLLAQKKKKVTIVVGLASYEIDLKEACKFFATKFSCGSSVSGDDEIVIQGDVKDDLFDILPEKWSQVVFVGNPPMMVVVVVVVVAVAGNLPMVVVVVVFVGDHRDYSIVGDIGVATGSGSVKRTRSPHGDTPPKPHDKVAKRGSANNADVEGGGGGDDPHEATGQQHERPMDEGLPDSLC